MSTFLSEFLAYFLPDIVVPAPVQVIISLFVLALVFRLIQAIIALVRGV